MSTSPGSTLSAMALTSLGPERRRAEPELPSCCPCCRDAAAKREVAEGDARGVAEPSRCSRPRAGTWLLPEECGREVWRAVVPRGVADADARGQHDRAAPPASRPLRSLWSRLARRGSGGRGRAPARTGLGVGRRPAVVVRRRGARASGCRPGRPWRSHRSAAALGRHLGGASSGCWGRRGRRARRAPRCGSAAGVGGRSSAGRRGWGVDRGQRDGAPVSSAAGVPRRRSGPTPRLLARRLVVLVLGHLGPPSEPAMRRLVTTSIGQGPAVRQVRESYEPG